MSDSYANVIIDERVVYTGTFTIQELRDRLADDLDIDSMDDSEILDAAVQHEATRDWLVEETRDENQVIGNRFSAVQQGHTQTFSWPVWDDRVGALSDNQIEDVLVKILALCDSVSKDEFAGSVEDFVNKTYAVLKAEEGKRDEL